MNRFYRFLETKESELEINSLFDFQSRWSMRVGEFSKLLEGNVFYIPKTKTLKVIANDLGIQVIELIYLLIPLCEQCRFRVDSRKRTDKDDFDVTPKVERRSYEFYGINPPTSKTACRDFYPFFNNYESEFRLV